MCFGGVKNYTIVHLDFEKDVYRLFRYQSKRRYSARKAWEVIRRQEPEKVEKIPPTATVGIYFDILTNLQIDSNRCDVYVTFKPFF